MPEDTDATMPHHHVAAAALGAALVLALGSWMTLTATDSTMMIIGGELLSLLIALAGFVVFAVLATALTKVSETLPEPEQ